jgi:hypothetical protein
MVVVRRKEQDTAGEAASVAPPRVSGPDTGGADRCTFPGCENKRFLTCHHIVHWIKGGRTDLDNLITVCTSHHALIHKAGWDVKLVDGEVVWFQPLAQRYEPGPPPSQHSPETPVLDVHLVGRAAGYSRMFDMVKLL